MLLLVHKYLFYPLTAVAHCAAVPHIPKPTLEPPPHFPIGTVVKMTCCSWQCKGLAHGGHHLGVPFVLHPIGKAQLKGYFIGSNYKLRLLRNVTRFGALIKNSELDTRSTLGKKLFLLSQFLSLANF